MDAVFNKVANIEFPYVELKIKRLHPDAVIPSYAKDGDAGLDLTAVSKEKGPNGICTYGTGLAIEIPYNYVGLIFPRSSIHKYELSLTNCVGVIDSGYRGEVMAKFRNTDWTGDNNSTYDIGDRIMQLIVLPYPKVIVKEVDELSSTERGEGGFGSTGK